MDLASMFAGGTPAPQDPTGGMGAPAPAGPPSANLSVDPSLIFAGAAKLNEIAAQLASSLAGGSSAPMPPTGPAMADPVAMGLAGGAPAPAGGPPGLPPMAGEPDDDQMGGPSDGDQDNAPPAGKKPPAKKKAAPKKSSDDAEY